MTEWVFYALLGPLFLTATCYIDKFSLGRYTSGMVDFLFFSTISSWAFVPMLALYFGLPELSWYALPAVLCGVVLVVSYFFYGVALAKGDTSDLMLLVGMIPIVTLAFGYILLGQQVSFAQILSSLFVVGGVLILSVKSWSQGVRLRRGAAWMFVAIFIWSALTLLSDWTLGKISFGSFIIWEAVGVAFSGPLMCLAPQARRKIVMYVRQASYKKYIWFNLNNFADISGQLLLSKALSLAPVAGLVVVVSQVQSFYTILTGLVLTLIVPQYIKEDISAKNIAKKLFGSAVILFGIYMLLHQE